MINWLFTSTPLLFFTQSFWRDEAFSYFLAGKNLIDIVILSAKDFTPPLYHLLLHFWLKIFGGSEISLRSFSLIFFWSTLYLVFLFLKNIFKLSSKKSFLYLLLFILNPFLIYYAFEARTYSFFAFLVCWSYYSFYKKNYKTYFMVTVLGLYTHYFMLFVILSQFLFIRITLSGARSSGGRDPDSAERGPISQRASAGGKPLTESGAKILGSYIFKSILLFLPWVIFVLLTKELSSSFWLTPTNSRTFVRLLGIVFTGFESNATWTAIFILFILLTAILKLKNKTSRPDLQLFILLALWGIGIPFLVAIISLIKPIFYPRYLIFAPIGLLLLIIYSLEHISYRTRILLFVLLILISFHYQKMLVEKRKKIDIRLTAQEVKPLAKKGDIILVTSELDFFTAKYYFPDHKVFIYNKTYEEIPDFTGKVMISRSDLAPSLPFYPNKAFILKSNGEYEIQALY